MKYQTQAAVSSAVGRLVRALEIIANADNWFHTTSEAGGPHTAWRGKGEPDEIAEKALQDAGFHYRTNSAMSIKNDSWAVE